MKSIRIWVAMSCLMALASTMMGQQPRQIQLPRFVRPEPEPPQSEFRIGLRYLSAPDVSFGGFGHVPQEIFNQTPRTNLASGQLKQDNFANGSIVRDLVLADNGLASVPLDKATGLERGDTSNFSFNSDDQLLNLTGGDSIPDTIRYERYSTTAIEAPDAEGSGESSIGMEVQYRRSWRPQGQLGFLVGLGFNGVDSSYQEPVLAQLNITRYEQPILGDPNKIRDLFAMDPDDQREDNADADTDNDGWRDSYPGSPSIGADDVTDPTRPRVPFVTGDPTLLTDQISVRPDAQFRAGLTTLRVGPTYDLSLFRRLEIGFSAGVASTLVDASLSERQVILPDKTKTPGLRERSQNSTDRISRKTDSDADLGLGGYLDASANYQLTEATSLFSGVQYQTGKESRFENDNGVHSTIDLSSQVYVQAGVGITF